MATLLILIGVIGFGVAFFMSGEIDEGKRFMRKHFPEEKY